MKQEARSSKASKRDEILNAAERAILQKGVAATTIDELIAEVGVSKNGFFYHFQDKNQMIEAILSRNLGLDEAWFAMLLGKADNIGNDPLETYLAFVELLAKEMGDMPQGHPGCMTTAVCYQDRLLNQSVRKMASNILEQWREVSLRQLQQVAARYPPNVDVDLEELADMLPALIDGSIIFGRVVADPTVLPRQIRLYGTMVETVFRPRASD